MGTAFVVDTLRKGDHRGFAHSVRSCAGKAHISSDAPDEHKATSCLLQILDGRLVGANHAIRVCFKLSFVVVYCELFGVSHNTKACVCDGDIDGAECIVCLFHCLCEVFVTCHIARDGKGRLS